MKRLNRTYDPVHGEIFSCDLRRKRGQTPHACNYNNIHAVKSQEVIMLTSHLNRVSLLPDSCCILKFYIVGVAYILNTVSAMFYGHVIRMLFDL